jgi:preprotein translocase subunit YajC
MLFLNLLLAEGAENTEGNAGSLVIMGLLVIAIIGLFIWQSYTNKKKSKEAKDMVDSLKIGDRVKTIGGICGFVAQINDDENTFVLETGLEQNKSYVKFDKGAIYQTAPAEGSANAKKNEEKKAESKKTEEVKEEVKTEETAE